MNVNSLPLEMGRAWDEKCRLENVVHILVGIYEQHKYLLWLQCIILPLMTTQSKYELGWVLS